MRTPLPAVVAVALAAGFAARGGAQIRPAAGLARPAPLTSVVAAPGTARLSLPAAAAAVLPAPSAAAAIGPAAIAGAPRPVASPPSAPVYRPKALELLLDRVEMSARSGRRPVVLFDLDDTLADTGYRQMAIVREFAARPDVRARFPGAAAKMSAIERRHVRYALRDTLRELAVEDAERVLAELSPFWTERFFERSYMTLDRAAAGGVDYVREVLRRGGTVVYLTGRWEDLRPGTVAGLAGMGYPEADGRRVLLVMKPDRSRSDVDFKKAAFDGIARLGEVVGGFENEPVNANAYKARFADGLFIFVDSAHSPTAIAPDPEIPWVRDFRR